MAEMIKVIYKGPNDGIHGLGYALRRNKSTEIERSVFDTLRVQGVPVEEVEEVKEAKKEEVK